MDLKKMIYAPKPNQSKTVTPKQQRLELIKNLIEEEQNRIRRLIVQMSNYNDEVVLQAFKSEINQVSTNLKSLTEERNKLEEELIHLSLTIDQREQIMEFASKIQQRIEDASFEEKCCIMDILDVQVVIHNDNQGKW